MSSRSPIQVPEELKTKVDDLKERFRAKTHYEVIENLVHRHEAFNSYKEQQEAKWSAEKLRQDQEMLQVGSFIKDACKSVKEDLSIKSDESLLQFLLHHYHQSNSFDKSTLMLLRDLK